MTQNNVVILILDSMRKDEFDRNMIEVGQKVNSEFVRCESVGTGTLPSIGGLFYSKLPHSSRMNFYEDRSEFTKYQDTFLYNLQNHNTGLISFFKSGSDYFNLARFFDEQKVYFRNLLLDGGVDPAQFTTENADEGKNRYILFLKKSLSENQTTKSLINGFGAWAGGLARSNTLPKLTDGGVNRAFKQLIKMVRKLEEPFFYLFTFGPLMDLTGLQFHI
jgi:hypothetical protein